MLTYKLKHGSSDTLSKLQPYTKYTLSFDLKTNISDKIKVMVCRSSADG
jgi:hypothetical protein